jgi:hypothetical protein
VRTVEVMRCCCCWSDYDDPSVYLKGVRREGEVVKVMTM